MTAQHIPIVSPCQVVTPAREGPKTVVVMGVSRGGTSMCAGLLRVFGVHMGERVSDDSQEDVEFHSNDIETLRSLIQKRNVEHQTWGWKFPHSIDYIREVQAELRNPHYIVIFRDLLSVAFAFERHHDVPIRDGLREVFQRYGPLVRFVEETTDAPLLCVSYEKAIIHRKLMVEGLADFTGVKLSEEQVDEYRHFINAGKYMRFSNFKQRLDNKAQGIA